MFKKLILAFTAILSLSSLPLSANTFDHKHTIWNELLQAHVIDHGNYSQVDYKGMLADTPKLDRYLAQLSALQQSEFNNWNREQQLATLINAYNAFTIKLILNHYPVKSIKDIGSFFTNSWKKKFFTFFGQKSYLDYIEHELIRANHKFNEPKIHFALVCASIGCPKLHNKAFTADNLEILLEAGTQSFLSDKSRNRFVSSKNLLQLSKIFDWYGKDFDKKFGSVVAFVAKYLSTDPTKQALIEKGQVNVEYLDYDWSLNDVK